MATDYGTGVASLSIAGGGLDLDPYFRKITGPSVVLYAVGRRFVTPRGSLWWAPNEGLDIRQWVLEGVRLQDLPTYEQLIVTEAERDQRVLSADARLSFADDTLTVHLSLRLATGTFSLVLRVSAVSASLLLAG